MSIYMYYHHIVIDNLYYEACLIEVVKVLLLDRILRTYIDHQLEPRVQYNRIFAEGSLEIVHARKMYFELGTTSNEVVGPLFIYGCCTTRCIEKIGYASYYIEPGRKSLRIQVEYILYERFFFTFGQDILCISFLGLGITITISAARVWACRGRCVGVGAALVQCRAYQ